MFSFTKTSLFNTSSFQIIKDSVTQSDGLPLAEVTEEEQWQATFEKHHIDFGQEEEAVYTPVITIWALISQVFFKEASNA